MAKKSTAKRSVTNPKSPIPNPRQRKYVFFFGSGKADGNRHMKDLLGGKGSGLAEMTNAGLPVPAGFGLNGKARRHRKAGIGHFGESGALTAKNVLHLAVAVCLAAAEGIDVFG